MSVALGNANLIEPAARQPMILVVEDHDDTREMLHMLLERWGCRVVEACNGLEAVEAASRERPQLILMDSRLPFLDGLEATRRIRENGLRDQVKILALNGSGSPTDASPESLKQSPLWVCFSWRRIPATRERS